MSVWSGAGAACRSRVILLLGITIRVPQQMTPRRFILQVEMCSESVSIIVFFASLATFLFAPSVKTVGYRALRIYELEIESW